MEQPTVVVVGSVNADLVVSVQELPKAGETVMGGTFARHGGGKGANQAVAAARLGARVAIVGAVGADDLGDEALRALAAEGIDVAAVARLDGVATGVAAIVVDERGENQIAVASGANAQLDGTMVEQAVARLLGPGTTGVVLLGHEVPEAAVAAGIHAARAAGWRVVLNPAPARALPDELEGVVLTPNAAEARTLAGEQDVEAAARALAARTGAPVLVTLGADGALLLDGDIGRSPALAADDGIEHSPVLGPEDHIERSPVLGPEDHIERSPVLGPEGHIERSPVLGPEGNIERSPERSPEGHIVRLTALAVEVVDTTGAGDAVNGALATELAAGRPLDEAARFAMAAAALSTRAAGARAGMPRRDDVLAAAAGL